MLHWATPARWSSRTSRTSGRTRAQSVPPAGTPPLRSLPTARPCAPAPAPPPAPVPAPSSRESTSRVSKGSRSRWWRRPAPPCRTLWSEWAASCLPFPESPPTWCLPSRPGTRNPSMTTRTLSLSTASRLTTLRRRKTWSRTPLDSTRVSMATSYSAPCGPAA
ncbi:hypothetical protein CRUP_000793 [Coryphaenoides rupestris]|nr:hypothetical protein CRUP_000793 [Coryphaenoides rupestris]